MKFFFKSFGIVLFFLIGWLIPSLYSLTESSSSSSLPPSEEKTVQMRPWRYIVIHHSGANSGNENIIESGHLQRGMENGMAYHFLIGNGSAGLKDGAIVEGRRWKYQIHGGHCHQDYLNEYGIGICFVGNFSSREPTPLQLKSLTELVLRLQKQFSIPDSHVLGHGQFYGEDSDCPGKLFPWTKFWSNLDKTYQLQLTNHSPS